MVDRINSIPNISCRKPQGAFYVMMNISKIKGKTIGGKLIKDSVSFCSALLEGANVSLIPGSAFGADDFVRMSYATSHENIFEGLNRIEKFLGE